MTQNPESASTNEIVTDSQLHAEDFIKADFPQYQEKYRLNRAIIRGVLNTVLWLATKTTVTGLEHVPDKGATIIMSNHVAGIDPGFAQVTITKRDVVPLAKIENYHHWFFRLPMRMWGTVPVRRSEIDRFALTALIDVLKNGYAVILAPEGTRSPALREAREGVAYIATKTNAVVVPMGVEGTKTIASSWKQLRRPTIEVKYGQPFRFKMEGRKRVGRDELNRMVQEAMYRIALLIPEYRRGFYSDLSKATTDTLEFVDPRTLAPVPELK